MEYTQLSGDEELIKEELIQLRAWKNEIGIPAQQKNEELLLIIEEHTIQNEALRQELETVQLQLETYTIEVGKLQTEKTDLEDEIKSLHHILPDADTILLSKSIQQKEEQLETLQNSFEKSQSQLLNDKQRIKQLSEENATLKTDNEQYQRLLEQLQTKDDELQKRMRSETESYNELKVKYSELEREFTKESEFSKQTSVIAQNLQSEVQDLRDQYQMSLQSAAIPEIDNFTDTTNKNLGGGHAPQKTLRMGPQTLRLTNLDFGNLNDIPMFGDDTTPRFSGHSQKATPIFHPFNGVQYDDTMRTNPLSDDGHDQYEDMKSAEDADLYHRTVNESELREQLETEFDDKLAKEKGKLIEKHQIELNEVKEQLQETTEQLRKYKQQLVRRNVEIKELKQVNGMKNGRAHHNQRQNPNNETDQSKCKVFGWVAW